MEEEELTPAERAARERERLWREGLQAAREALAAKEEP